MSVRPASVHSISDRDLLEYLADGFTTGEIAVQYGYTQQTICDRVRTIKQRYRARTNEQLVVLAIRSGELNIGLSPSFFGIPVVLDPSVVRGTAELREAVGS